MILNIKRIVIRMDGHDEETLYLSAKGAGDVKAKDLKLPAGVEVVNPKAHIATLSASGRLEDGTNCRPGVGYRTADGNKGGSALSVSFRSTRSFRLCARLLTRWRTPRWVR